MKTIFSDRVKFSIFIFLSFFLSFSLMAQLSPSFSADIAYNHLDIKLSESTDLNEVNSEFYRDQIKNRNLNPYPLSNIPLDESVSGSQRRLGLLYHLANYAPLGLMFATETEGIGIYIAIRISPTIFKPNSPYELSSGAITDDYWNFNYTGESEYRRGSFTFGITYKIFGDLTKISLHGYGGLGYGVASYFYQYEISSYTGSYGKKWIKDTDLSSKGIEFETGIIMTLYGCNLSLGATVLKFAEPMITAGIGFSFLKSVE